MNRLHLLPIKCLARLSHLSALTLLTLASSNAPRLVQAAEPEAPGVLVLESETPQSGEVEGEKNELLGDVLLREFARQAVLIAARDELGLATRDAALREPEPSRDIFSETLSISTIAREHTGMTLTLRHGNEVLLNQDIECDLGTVASYLEILAQMEELSRGGFREAIAETDLLGVPTTTADDGDLSADIEELLLELNILSQYEAVRLLHSQIRAGGQSTARLGALVQAYSNLGQLSQPYLSSMHKSFRARALLYAQRMIAADPNSPEGYWYRAYAFSLAGMQSCSTADITRATTLAEAAGEIEPPAWVSLLTAFNHYDYAPLQEATESEDKYNQLASLLWFTSVEPTNCTPMVLDTGSTILESHPSQLRVIDGMFDRSGVSMQHRLVRSGPDQFTRLLARELQRHECLPEDIRSTYGGRNNEQLALHEYRYNLSSDLVLAAETDVQEPSLAVMGRMLDEQNVVLIWRTARFLRDYLGVDSEAFLNEQKQALAEHPYGLLVMAVSLVKVQDRQPYERIVSSVEMGDINISSMLWLLSRLPVDTQLANMNSTAAWLSMESQASPFDEEMFQILICTYPEDQLELANSWEDVSRHSPMRISVLIERDWDYVLANLEELEAENTNQPLIDWALAKQFENHGDPENAIQRFRSYLSQVPSNEAAVSLARLLYNDANEEWVTTLETGLEYQDYGLDHAGLNCRIASTYMNEGKYEQALPYARAAAESYSAWGLQCLANCQEGLGKHEEADAIVAAIGNRYGADTPYCWCVRTGRGDLDEAWFAYRQYIQDTYPGRQSIRTAVEIRYLIHRGEKQAALDFAEDHYTDLTSPSDLAAVMLLAEELGNDEFAQQVLDTITQIERRTPPRVPLAGFLVDMYDLETLEKESVEGLLQEHPEVGDGTAYAFLGWHLVNQGEAELAKYYLIGFASYSSWSDSSVLLCQCKLRDIGLELPDYPHTYYLGFTKPDTTE